MQTDFDIAIIGGGLGGLSLSILLSRMGYKVILFEKETYPFHKVCGEYISNESKGFIEHLGINLDYIGASNITQLTLSTPKGKTLHSSLDLGGFGVSRYKLDASLATIAEADDVTLLDNTKVDDIRFQQDYFTIHFKSELVTAKVVAGAYGKKANLDVKLDRPFTHNKPDAKHNYIGVKYHVAWDDFPKGHIELHNFTNGYCGMSAIEENKYCMCYLTTSENLKKAGSIAGMEKHILYTNPLLAERMQSAKHLYKEPLTISQVNFKPKAPVEDHLLMLGDAAGTIAPLCGNGMSMSMNAAYILSQLIGAYLNGAISREQLENDYAKKWNSIFQPRIKAGYHLQQLFGKSVLSEASIRLLKQAPFITNHLIKLTHGSPFFVNK